MTAELFQQIEAEGGIVDLRNRAKFRLTGGDRVRYLNGQVTNDVRKASPTQSLYACVTDAKGRIAGDVFIHAASDALMVDAEEDLRDLLGPRLEKYIIADDVELTDVSDEWHLWHVFGPAAKTFTPGENGALKSTRLGLDGVDLWLAPDALPPQTAAPILSAQDYETLRILRGIPRYPNELNGDAFPPEAGIEERSMSYTKGCYIGQEILSRIRTTGKMPRELIQWQSEAPVTVGETVFTASEPVKAIGTITSVAWHPVQQKHVGLAFVKQGNVTAHSKLPVGADQPRIDAAIELFAFVK